MNQEKLVASASALTKDGDRVEIGEGYDLELLVFYPEDGEEGMVVSLVLGRHEAVGDVPGEAWWAQESVFEAVEGPGVEASVVLVMAKRLAEAS